MRKFYLFAAAAVLLTACVKTQNLDEVTPIGADESAVSFDVYTSRATKAGMPKSIDTQRLKEGPGFGVFAYYTDNGKYDQYVKPNFMYNQQVQWNSTANRWVYEPVKYWPNETGDAARSDDKDYVSFFAYAPYVISDPSTGAVKVPKGRGLDETEEQRRNITGMINNSTMGDPKIKYVVDFNPATSVDLLWGVNKETELPFLNLEKPKTADKTEFLMQHALVKLNVQIDAFVDGTDVTKPLAEDDSTRIYVRSVTFEGFATKGTLNLNNTAKDPLWLDYAGIDNLLGEPVTIFDGRKDGKEGYKDGEATREKVVGIDSILVQSAPYTEKTKVTPGVTNKPVNLFTPIDRTAAKPEEDPIYVIPNGDPVKITIVYDVETKDSKLAGYLSDGVTHGSTIENTITKEIKYTDGTKVIMQAGYVHIFRLHLGMTSVKVDAEVKTWVSEHEYDRNVDLPANSN